MEVTAKAAVMGDDSKGDLAERNGLQHSHKNGYTNPVFESDQKLGFADTPISTVDGELSSKDAHKKHSLATASSVDTIDPHDERCGCCLCYPTCLQKLAKPVAYLVSICALVFIQSMVVSGYSSGILTTIEKRYELSGSELGLVISSYDIASLTAGIIVSYYGDQRNRATWLGRGALVICLGSILFSMPHFIGGDYVIESSLNSTTPVNNICNSSQPPVPEDCDDKTLVSDRWAFGIFMGAFAIIGFGSSPIYSLGPTYLYDNVKPSRYPVYAGLMYSMGALGPACGFLLAGLFVEFYVHPEDPPKNYEVGCKFSL